MDTIDVVLNRSPDDNPVLHYINLILNGTPATGTFDAIGFLTSYLAFRKVDTELMTCSCGAPGCAGVFYGTAIKQRRYTVEWRDIDSGLPKKFYSFNIREYEAAVYKVYELLYSVAQEMMSYEKTEEDMFRTLYPDDIESLNYVLDWCTSEEYTLNRQKYYNAIVLSPDQIKERKRKCVL